MEETTYLKVGTVGREAGGDFCEVHARALSLLSISVISFAPTSRESLRELGR